MGEKSAKKLGQQIANAQIEKKIGYQSIHFDKLSCWQVSFSGPSREDHKHFQRPEYILTLSQPAGSVNLTA
jgi:hypothetical protein